MKSITSRYIENAILQVSDSYCSWPSNQACISPPILPQASTPNTVTCMYKAKVPSRTCLVITLTWCNHFTGGGHGLTIKVGSNSHQLRSYKGSRAFKSSNSDIEIIWDISNADFLNGPEPSSGFSITVLVDSQVCLLLGDDNRDDELLPFSMVSRTETTLVGNSTVVYSTKARFCDNGSAHDISIKCSGNEGEEEELSVRIDEKKVFEVKRLRWNFRGNQVIFLDGLLVDLMWDLHEWLFRGKKGKAVFMFRTRSGFHDHSRRLCLDQKSGCFEHEFSLLICACKYY